MIGNKMMLAVAVLAVAGAAGAIGAYAMMNDNGGGDSPAPKEYEQVYPRYDVSVKVRTYDPPLLTMWFNSPGNGYVVIYGDGARIAEHPIYKAGNIIEMEIPWIFAMSKITADFFVEKDA